MRIHYWEQGMNRLILHPTETGQWYTLVNEAQEITNVILNEDTESYLVFLLMRFSKTAQLMESVLGLDFLSILQESRTRQIEQLKELGDKSLLFCGLFPGLAKRRSVSLNYFSEIGQSAYLNVSGLVKNQSKELFSQLSDEFLNLQRILQAMRTEYWQFKDINPQIVATISNRCQ